MSKIFSDIHNYGNEELNDITTRPKRREGEIGVGDGEEREDLENGNPFAYPLPQSSTSLSYPGKQEGCEEDPLVRATIYDIHGSSSAFCVSLYTSPFTDPLVHFSSMFVLSSGLILPFSAMYTWLRWI